MLALTAQGLVKPLKIQLIPQKDLENPNKSRKIAKKPGDRNRAHEMAPPAHTSFNQLKLRNAGQAFARTFYWICVCACARE